MIRNLCSTLVCALALALSNACLAGEAAPPLSARSAMLEFDPVVQSDWDFDAWLDGWIVQLAVGVSVPEIGFDKGIFIGFDDIISNIDWMVPFGADLRYKRLGFMPDVVGLKMSGSGQTPGPLFDKLEVGLKFWSINLAGYYRLIEKPNFSLDLVGGARFLYVGTDLAFTGGAAGRNLRSHSTHRIWDAIGGVRIQQNLTEKLFYSVYGDVGAGDSELTYQVMGSLGYQVSENFSAALGYRYLHYDEEAGFADVGITASGPQVTLKWAF